MVNTDWPLYFLISLVVELVVFLWDCLHFKVVLVECAISCVEVFIGSIEGLECRLRLLVQVVTFDINIASID